MITRSPEKIRPSSHDLDHPYIFFPPNLDQTVHHGTVDPSPMVHTPHTLRSTLSLPRVLRLPRACVWVFLSCFSQQTRGCGMEDISSASSTAAVCSLCDRGAVYAFEGDVASLCGTHQPIDPVEALTQVVTGMYVFTRCSVRPHGLRTLMEV